MSEPRKGCYLGCSCLWQTSPQELMKWTRLLLANVSFFNAKHSGALTPFQKEAGPFNQFPLGNLVYSRSPMQCVQEFRQNLESRHSTVLGSCGIPLDIFLLWKHREAKKPFHIRRSSAGYSHLVHPLCKEKVRTRITTLQKSHFSYLN